MKKIYALIPMACMMLFPAVNAGAYAPCKDYYDRTGIVSVNGDVIEGCDFGDAGGIDFSFYRDLMTLEVAGDFFSRPDSGRVCPERAIIEDPFTGATGWDSGGTRTGYCPRGKYLDMKSDRNCTAGTDVRVSVAGEDSTVNGRKILYVLNVDDVVLPGPPHVACFRPHRTVRPDACVSIPPFAAGSRTTVEIGGTSYDRPSVVFELDGLEGYAPCGFIDRGRYRRSGCACDVVGMKLPTPASPDMDTSLFLLAGIGILGAGSLLKKLGN